MVAYIIEKCPDSEETQFFIFVNIMHLKNHRACFDQEMSFLHSIVDEIGSKMKSQIPNIYKHIMRESSDHLVIIFIQVILPIFTQDFPKIPCEQIFDLFLLED